MSNPTETYVKPVGAEGRSHCTGPGVSVFVCATIQNLMPRLNLSDGLIQSSPGYVSRLNLLYQRFVIRLVLP